MRLKTLEERAAGLARCKVMEEEARRVRGTREEGWPKVVKQVTRICSHCGRTIEDKVLEWKDGTRGMSHFH